MFKGRFSRSFCLRPVLEVLAGEAALIALVWLLFRLVSLLQHYYFSDLLFLVGALELLFAGVAMLGTPDYVSSAPWKGMPAPRVQATEEEKRFQALAEMVENRPFVVRLGASGALTILAAVALLFI